MCHYYKISLYNTDREHFNLHNPYRYGFNNKELDNEIQDSGNSFDFGARVYDSRPGRWLSLGPMNSKYPQMSPYNGIGNNPLLFIDKIGEDIVIYGLDFRTKEAVPILIIKTNSIKAKKFTQLIAPLSYDVVTHKPHSPLVIDLTKYENTINLITKADAFMISIGGAYAETLGVGASAQIVLINAGDDHGIYFHLPSAPERSVGNGGSVGVEYGPIEFNYITGKKLNRSTFEGKSEGFAGSALGVGIVTVVSYANSEYGNLFQDNGPVLYMGELVSCQTSYGSEVELRYYWSKSKLMDDWSIPFNLLEHKDDSRQ